MWNYVIENWMDKTSKDIQENISLWNAVCLSSCHRWNPSFLPNDFIPHVCLYPISSPQDWTKPSRLLIWWNIYRLHKWWLNNNTLAIYRTLSGDCWWKLWNYEIFNDIIEKSKKVEDPSLWFFHREWYKKLSEILNFQLSDFSDLILENRDLVRSILYNTITYIKTYCKNYSEIIYEKIFYKNIDIFWIMHNQSNKILEKQDFNPYFLIDEFFSTIDNINKAKKWEHIESFSWVFISWSFAVFLYDILLWKKASKNLIYHFSSKTHYESWKQWTDQNNFFNNIYNYLLENGVDIPKNTTSYVIYHTLADRFTFWHPKRSKEDLQEYWLILENIIKDYKDFWDFSIIKMKKFFDKMESNKKWNLWWNETITDYVTKHKKDLTYFLSWYDQLLLYKNVWMLNSPITWYDNLTYQEKSDIQEKIRAKMSIYNK